MLKKNEEKDRLTLNISLRQEQTSHVLFLTQEYNFNMSFSNTYLKYILKLSC